MIPVGASLDRTVCFALGEAAGFSTLSSAAGRRESTLGRASRPDERTHWKPALSIGSWSASFKFYALERDPRGPSGA